MHDELLSRVVADPDCPDVVANMLAVQEEDTELFHKYLSYIRARNSCYPARFNRLRLYVDKYGIQWYTITNYDYQTYKWAMSLGLEPDQLKVGASRLGFRCSALPLELIKKMEAKLDEQENQDAN